MKILLLEDEDILRKNIEKFLILKGYKVDSFDNGSQLLDIANLFEYDFFVLDINVPDIDGFEILKYIKGKNIETPAIFISGMIDIEDLSKGFGLGCSDYLKKPFDLEELELRLKNIKNSFTAHERIILSNGLIYDFDAKSIFKENKIIELSKKQSIILYILMKNNGNVVTFDTIADYAYEDDFRDIHTISSHIRDIRKMIGSEVIKNVRGVGYKVVL
ncbi:response regulator transcription factor [Hydrogenimonas thermophila]|uniref:DNA-binding response regulator, OmpR family, contains REC and winged-helix (WHTH) domain n=1 Tax=Hydrogenimonas thermophila TaxID=223786 RepID=A0A1I5SPL5_9BACT|nr:response regulator transcription factor [Hydrogenimonas thermophila]SFP72722.1 DNA-binding response regulator, OmpR family, contains REC and winged-helix (wHTH) domain [Hydrogenimonas thermophila]